MDYEMLFGKPAEEYRCCRNCKHWHHSTPPCARVVDLGEVCEEWVWDENSGENICSTCEHIKKRGTEVPCTSCRWNSEGKNYWKSRVIE